MPTTDDEFAEFDTDEATFDAMMEAAEPAELADSAARTTATVAQGNADASFTISAPRSSFFTIGSSTRSNASSFSSGPPRLPTVRKHRREEQLAG